MDGDDGAGEARRTRVVLAEAALRRPTDHARSDLAEQTPVGEALVKGLVRAQLALALRMALVVVTALGSLPPSASRLRAGWPLSRCCLITGAPSLAAVPAIVLRVVALAM